MAFEDFVTSEPVLASTDYDKIKIKRGEGAHTDNFNRGIVDSINRDAALESALTYLARSSSLFVTANTRFLSHCEGQGVDLIYANPPILTTPVEDIFLVDGVFIGAAWPQRAVRNMMQNAAANSSMKTLEGWTVANPEKLNASIISTADNYTVISTTQKADDIFPDTVVLETDIVPLTGTGAATLNKVSGGLTFTTEDNMMATGTEFTYIFSLLNDKKAVIDSHRTSVIAGGYDAVVGVENIDLPADAKYFQIQLRLEFKNEDSRASFTLKNVMVQAGGILVPYVEKERPQCSCKYNKVVDPTLGNITVSCWSRFKRYSLKTHAGPIGPIFIQMGGLTIGGVHRAQDGEKLILQLYYNMGGQPVYGPSFEVPDQYVDDYLLSAVRIRPNEENPDNSVVEFSIIAGPQAYKSSLEIPTSWVTFGNLILGNDNAATDFFNGPVTEVRYDKEWINDTELYMISLAKKPFSFKRSNDLGAADAGESVLETLDKVGVNLILNPTGKLALVGWNNYPERYFTVIHNDVYAGNCFAWIGNATAASEIVSDKFPVKSSTLYSLRGVMFSEQGSGGGCGLGIIWYDKDGKELSKFKANMTHIYQPKNYSLSSVAPNNAVYASVFMYVDANLRTTKVTWSRLKFEMGDPTQFTDDAGAGYALYY